MSLYAEQARRKYQDSTDTVIRTANSKLYYAGHTIDRGPLLAWGSAKIYAKFEKKEDLHRKWDSKDAGGCGQCEAG